MGFRKHLLSAFGLTLILSLLLGCIAETTTTTTDAALSPMPGEGQEKSEGDGVEIPLPETPSAWAFFDPRDATLPDLIKPGEDGLRLDPDWEVTRIDYVYEWWGLAEPLFDYQWVELADGGYHRAEQPVDAQAVAGLLKAISNLHPSQTLLAGNSHTDDYPSWTVELTGADDQRVLIFSSSTGNPGSGPWNVLCNGRLYAQYDGSLGEPLAQLFSSPTGAPAASFQPGGREPGTVAFATMGWPNQLTQGFVGLLPIADDFEYQADAESGEIHGTIQGRSSIGGFGNMIVGSITELSSVELVVHGGGEACDLDEMPTDDPAGAAWTFACAVDNITPGARYRYPIQVAFRTDSGAELNTAGELTGVWAAPSDVLLLPPSEELQTALLEAEPAADLLADHVLVRADFVAQIDAAETGAGVLSGEAILVGQTELNGLPLRYTIGTPFVLQDGQLAHWNLTRDALQQLLQEILQLPLTRRIADAAPDVILNMWYAESGEMPDMRFLVNANPVRYETELQTCGRLPQGIFPREGEPLRAFGFNSVWSFWMADFVLVDGVSVVNDLDLWPNYYDREGLLPLLIPPQLDTGEHMPFDRIWMQGSPFFGDQPTLTLRIPEGADSASREVYQNIAGSLPVRVDQAYGTLWEATGLTFVVTEQGALDIVACDATRAASE